jgi:hypothetical protein
MKDDIIPVIGVGALAYLLWRGWQGWGGSGSPGDASASPAAAAPVPAAGDYANTHLRSNSVWGTLSGWWAEVVTYADQFIAAGHRGRLVWYVTGSGLSPSLARVEKAHRATPYVDAIIFVSLDGQNEDRNTAEKWLKRERIPYVLRGVDDDFVAEESE